jgi:nucleotide-binding universal stress UspA family protein
MQEIRQVIVPVDFNEHSDTLAEFAFYFADKMNAKVTFVHVMKHLPDYSDFEQSLEQLEHNFLIHAEKKMVDFLEKIQSRGRNCSGQVLSGVAADAIIAYAKEKEGDMIIISTHGSQGIEKILLGSVADRVIKGAHCPTLVFNPFKGKIG